MRLHLAVLLAVVVGSVPVGAEAGPPQLNVLMDVDKQQATRGEILNYEVRVTNLAQEEALHVQMSSHLPEHTTGVTDQCPDGPIEPDGDICIAPSVPTPGLGDAFHQVQMGFGPLGSGETATFRFSVRINDDAPIGLKIRNHAHAEQDHSSEDSNHVQTRVVSG